MDNTLIYIYKERGDVLKNYNYIRDYSNIPVNAEIIYIKKGSKLIKTGKFIGQNNNSIVKIENSYKRIVYIYPNDYHVFFSYQTSNMSDFMHGLNNEENNKNSNKNKTEFIKDDDKKSIKKSNRMSKIAKKLKT
jgi:hypothetical protein